MGQRGGIETVVAVLRSFLETPTWTQAALARRVGIGTPALRKHLLELQRAGFPFESEVDHPHVYWSVPKGWFPGAVALQTDEASEMLRQITHAPRSKARDKLIRAILYRLQAPADAEATVVVPQSSAAEEKLVPLVEDAAAQKKPLDMRYYSSSRGHVSQRFVSVHRLVVGPPARFVAYCHTSKALRWFRVENIVHATLSADEQFVPVKKADVDHFQETSLDGFHDAVQPEVERFFVRDPEARWVVNNLLGGMKATQVDGGIRIETETCAVSRLAQYVVGLGGAAHAETDRLATMVRELAEGAIASGRPRHR
jgi:proteasome accessory factor C